MRQNERVPQTARQPHLTAMRVTGKNQVGMPITERLAELPVKDRIRIMHQQYPRHIFPQTGKPAARIRRVHPKISRPAHRKTRPDRIHIPTSPAIFLTRPHEPPHSVRTHGHQHTLVIDHPNTNTFQRLTNTISTDIPVVVPKHRKHAKRAPRSIHQRPEQPRQRRRITTVTINIITRHHN